MKLHKEKKDDHFIKIDLYQDFIDDLFVAKVRLVIKDLQDEARDGVSNHPEDIKVYEEQLIAHRKILQWHAPESEWEFEDDDAYDSDFHDFHGHTIMSNWQIDQEEEEGNW